VEKLNNLKSQGLNTISVHSQKKGTDPNREVFGRASNPPQFTIQDQTQYSYESCNGYWPANQNLFFKFGLKQVKLQYYTHWKRLILISRLHLQLAKMNQEKAFRNLQTSIHQQIYSCEKLQDIE
jgi:hypothetical protein